MMKINLAPDVRLDKLKTKRRNFIVTVTAVVTLAIMVVFILILQGYKWSRAYSLDQTKKKIASTQDELKSYKDIEDMVINIEQGTKAVNEIEKAEPKWSKFFPVLQEVTPNDIKFVDLSNTGFKFTAKLQGKDISSIARVIRSLDTYKDKTTGKNLFKNVNVDGYTVNEKDGLIDFDMTFEMEEGILW